MRGFVCVLVCVAALAAQVEAQWQPGGGGQGGFPGQGGPGHGGPGHGGPGQGGPGQGFPGPIAPVYPDPSRTEKCAKYWMEEGNSCYLFDSGAILRQVTGPLVVNNQEGLFQAAANMYCGQMYPGASLVTVNDLTENNFLYEWAVRMTVEPQPVWIGLHAGPAGIWQWYSGEPATFSNWEEIPVPMPEPGHGAMLFDASVNNQIFNNQVEISAKWVSEQGLNEPHALICEYHPSGMTATHAPVNRTTTGAAATTMAGTRSPAMLNNNPAHLQNGGGFGGSRLFEVPRRQRNRPANYRMNPYYGVMP